MASSLAYLGSFAPRVGYGSLSGETGSALRLMANFFHLGACEVYHIHEINGQLLASPIGVKRPSIGSVVLRVVALATLVLPLVASLGAISYGNLNDIQIDPFPEMQRRFYRLLDEARAEVIEEFVKSPAFAYLLSRSPGMTQESCYYCLRQDNAPAFKIFTRLLGYDELPMMSISDFELFLHEKRQTGASVLSVKDCKQLDHIDERWQGFNLAQKADWIGLKSKNEGYLVSTALFENEVLACVKRVCCFKEEGALGEKKLCKALVEHPYFEEMSRLSSWDSSSSSLTRLCEAAWQLQYQRNLQEFRSITVAAHIKCKEAAKRAEMHYFIEALLSSKYHIQTRACINSLVENIEPANEECDSFLRHKNVY